MRSDDKKALRFRLVGGTLVQVPDALSRAPLMPLCVSRLWSDTLIAMSESPGGVLSLVPAMKSRAMQMRVDPYDLHWEDLNFLWPDFHRASQRIEKYYIDISIDVMVPSKYGRIESESSIGSAKVVTVTASAQFVRSATGEFLPLIRRGV